jgi:hypothetical protein
LGGGVVAAALATGSAALASAMDFRSAARRLASSSGVRVLAGVADGMVCGEAFIATIDGCASWALGAGGKLFQDRFWAGSSGF